MQQPSKQKRAFRLLILLSLMVHVGLYTAFLSFRDHVTAPPSAQPEGVTVQLRQPPAEKQEQEELAQEQQQEESHEEIVKQDPPEQHLPAHTSDNFASDNQDDASKTEVVAGGGKASEQPMQEVAKGAEVADAEQNLAQTLSEELDVEEVKDPESQSIVTTKGTSDLKTLEKGEDTFVSGADALAELIRQQAGEDQGSAETLDEQLSIPKEFLDGYGNLALLSDSELRDADVPQPFSESKSKELELANKYLARMNDQVMEYWINPYSGNKMFRGIIKVELGLDGYLRNAFVYRSSGQKLLDISVLDAIRSVPRFEVPADEVLTARYYTNLSFHYSSIEEKPELMPFDEGYAKLD